MSEEKIWKSEEISEDKARYLSSNLERVYKDFPLPISKLLLSIGIDNPNQAYQYLKPTPMQLHNPFLLKDMEKSIHRINQAINNGEKIIVHGDYDADGVTTTALFIEGFRLLGIDVDYYVPNRFEDGYGLNIKNVEKFAKEYDLIISGDTGIKEFDTSKRIKQTDGAADLIITDHHEPLVLKGNELSEAPESGVKELYGEDYIILPDAFSVINQHRLGDPYPNKSLSGVAVVFKLFEALFISRGENLNPLYNLLDLVAIGLIADLVPQLDFKKSSHETIIDFEVRTMSHYGINIMNKKPKPWLGAIKEITGIDEDINSGHVGFRIGPLFNAPGRLEDPTPAVELLIERDYEKAFEKAKELRDINELRKKQTSDGCNEVFSSFEAVGEEAYDFGISVQSDSFHIGIAGLVASKLCQHYYRPSIALAPVEVDGKTVLKGSARSIPGIHVLNMMQKVQRVIGPFVHGGHSQAAGMTLEPERFEEFRDAFREACSEHESEAFTPVLSYNAKIELEDVTFEMIDYLKMLEPFGQGNREPLFRTDEVEIKEFKPIMEGKGCIITVTDGTQKIKGIKFSDGEAISAKYENALLNSPGNPKANILYKAQTNTFRGNTTLQLGIEDIRFI